ncbi:MAG: GH23 [uncultured Solirubrobacteraceae bacterium]|uniref:GH23 n=1 Tax=uncultured Solirubrobacteraceae bacterium TaxID=1162706 RepID=A0A6J4RQ31_9ACTN|nr:MAG: GH23 [uncultured Solirubrobacteraceae bacterium]
MASLLRRALALLAVVALAVVAVIVLFPGETNLPRLVPGTGADNDPLAYTSAREDAFAQAAARGHAHVIYAKSPGGARASAARTARYRSLVEAAAEAAEVQPDTLEAIVLLESAGRPDAVADPRLEGAVGLTQILAETGRNLLEMKVDPAAARRIGRSLRRATRAGDTELIGRLRARRRAVDERFDPPKALAAAARYLKFARGELGRDDLAVVSYHMGVGNLQSALSAYGEDDISYARLYFDSTPLEHEQAYRKLAALGDDSATYLWRVEAAREIMRLYRSDPAQLDRISALQTAKNSAEEVLHPRAETKPFRSPSALREAYDDGRLAALRRTTLAKYGLRIDRGMGELAPRLQRRKTTYRGLRPPALALLTYLGAGVKSISGSEGSLAVTSTVRDERYQRLLLSRNREATPNYSLHTTGWAFDLLRTYRSKDQALALQFMLERLQSHNLIAWVREPAAIHITVSADARRLAAVLEP